MIYPEGGYNDIDWVILSENMGELIEYLFDAGFNKDSNYAEQKFTALRCGNLNYILVSSRKQYDAWKAATQEARNKKLKTKKARIALFEKMRAGI